jgi:hypothetical protein
MEGSMKMMSWSRYHCLSWSLMHAARRRRAAKIHRRRRRNHAFIGGGSAPRSAPGLMGPAECFQFVIRMFRTKAQSGSTDI